MSLPVRKDEMIPQPHGGALRNGGTNKGGPGRPKDALRAKLRKLAEGKGVPFLRELMKGDVRVRFIGKCPECEHDQAIDDAWVRDAVAALNENVRARLMANDQMLKYGLGTQVEQVTKAEIEQDAKAMLSVFVDWAREKWNIPTEQIQECAAAMARAVTTTTEG